MRDGQTIRTPVIIGPTASGKSTLAVEVALALREQYGLRPEIITADAFQIYRGMEIGTAKPTVDERRGVPHRLIDMVDPHEQGPGGAFTVEDWLRACRGAIEEIRSHAAGERRGEVGSAVGVPIVVGGTSLYIQSLLRGLFEGPAADEALRAELHGWSRAALREQLERVDPAAAARIHPNDVRRTVRAIEVFRLTGSSISTLQKQWEADDGATDEFALIILSWPVEALNRRINGRVRQMVDRGLLDEVRGLVRHGPLNMQAREALGYKQMLAHLASPATFTLEEAVERIKVETRRFGKNQRTWMRRLATTPGAITLDASTVPIAGSGGMVERVIEAMMTPVPGPRATRGI